MQFDKPVEFCSAGRAEKTAGLGPVLPLHAAGPKCRQKPFGLIQLITGSRCRRSCGRHIRQVAVNIEALCRFVCPLNGARKSAAYKRIPEPRSLYQQA